jgi:O-antigen/teichoic acid export membrane protein
MSLNIPRYVRQRLFGGGERTRRTKKNIVALFFLRGISILINLLLVPLTLGYLNQTGYGIWITLSSTISWVGMLDIGLGNGLRNEFARALALGDRESARISISTTYACVGAIVVVLLILFFVANPFLPWTSILNAPQEMEAELAQLAASVFVFFCLRLLFGLIGTVLLADQKPAFSALLDVVNSGIALSVVYVLTRVSHGSLFLLGSLVSLIAAAVPFAANLYLFRGRYRDFAPSIHFVRRDRARKLVSLGVQFFLLQISGVVIFTSANLIIIQLFGSAEVTRYNIAFKYYGVALMGFTVLLTPFWSAYTEAYTKTDIRWITMTTRKLMVSFGVLVCVLIAMTLAAPRLYLFWVGPDIRVPTLLSLSMAAYVLVVAWSSIFAYFVNGTGKIGLQLRVAVLMAIAIVPLAIMFSTNLHLGPAGVMIAICVSLSPGCVLWPIQMRKILSGRATGIWSR